MINAGNLCVHLTHSKRHTSKYLPYNVSVTFGTLCGSNSGKSIARSMAALTDGALVSPSSSSRDTVVTGSVEVRSL